MNKSVTPNETTRMAQSTTVLSPRFYTTDFAALEKIDVGSVRDKWDALIEEFRRRSEQGPLCARR